MAANRTAFVLETLQGILDADSIIKVRKRWKVPNVPTGEASCYLYLAATAFNEVYEDGRSETGTMTVIAAFDMKKAIDASETGLADAAYADLIYRVEKLIGASVWPKVNADATFRVYLNSVRVSAVDGHIDEAGDMVKFGIALEIPFTQVAV